MGSKSKNPEFLRRKEDSPVRSFLEKLKDTKEKGNRLKAIQTITRLKEPWVNDALIGALEDSSQEIVSFIIKELGRREDLDLNKLYKRLQQPPWYVRNAILKILGIKKNPSSVQHIKAVLYDPNSDVRRTVALTLGQIGGKEAMGLLVKLTTDKNPFIKRSAEEVLRKASDLKFC